MLNTIHTMDALELIAQIPDESIDLCFCDPPYNVSHSGKIFKDYRRKDGEIVRGITTYDYGAWDYGYDPIPFLNAAKRTLVPGGSFVIFTSEQLYGIYRQWAEDDDEMLAKQVIIWEKTNPLPNFRKVSYRQSTELMIWMSKGKISKNNPNFIFTTQQATKNIKKYPICGGNERLKRPDTGKSHPNQKPVALCKEIIATHCRADGTVLDPYCGVGSIADAAQQLGRNFICSDIDGVYTAMARKRILT